MSARRPVRFASGRADCSAWRVRGSTGACVVMAAGLGVTKEPGTDRFAARFAEAGLSVLAFDYRRLGTSGGRPRQVVRMRDQLADWQAAIAFARGLPEVDPRRVAIWGHSASGGHVIRIAARTPGLGAVIAQAPNADGVAVFRNARRHTPLLAGLRLVARAARDAAGGLVGRDPLLIPLAGARGTVASLTTPDARNGAAALDPDGRYDAWQQQIAARSAFAAVTQRPFREAGRAAAPLLVVACDADGVTPPGPAYEAAARAPRGELVVLHGGHYAPYLQFEEAVDTQLAFLRSALRLAPLAAAAPGR